MSAVIVGICNALSCSDLWKYVFNAMTIHSHCCNDYISCDCETTEIEIEDDKPSWWECCIPDKIYDSDEYIVTCYSRDI